MALVLHKGRLADGPLRLDNQTITALLLPYVGKRVLVHLASEERRLSWTGKGVLTPVDGWSLRGGLPPLTVIPFDLAVGHECVLSVIPEPETSNGADVDDLIKQAQSLVDILNRVKRA